MPTHPPACRLLDGYPVDTGTPGRHRAAPPRAPRPVQAAAVAGFTAVAAAANAATFDHPLIPVGFGRYATTSTLAVAFIAAYNRWLREAGGQRLVYLATGVAGVAATCLGGVFGLGWAVAYLVADTVGWCTWRPLRRLGAHDRQAMVAFVLTSVLEATVYVAVVGVLVPVTVLGQLLGKAEAAAATLVLLLPFQQYRPDGRPGEVPGRATRRRRDG
jgi:hypothetical protein